MGTASEGTEGAIEEDILPQRVIVVFPLPLARWGEIIFWYWKHTERSEGLSSINS